MRKEKKKKKRKAKENEENFPMNVKSFMFFAGRRRFFSCCLFSCSLCVYFACGFFFFDFILCQTKRINVLRQARKDGVGEKSWSRRLRRRQLSGKCCQIRCALNYATVLLAFLLPFTLICTSFPLSPRTDP